MALRSLMADGLWQWRMMAFLASAGAAMPMASPAFLLAALVVRALPAAHALDSGLALTQQRGWRSCKCVEGQARADY